MRFQVVLSVLTLFVFADISASSEDTVSSSSIEKNKPALLITSTPNQSPTANAGSDQTVEIGHPITLNANKSRDVEGPLIGYVWSEINTIYGTVLLSTKASFTKVDFPLGEHILSLTVTNARGVTATDTITITVKEAENQNPIAIAGQDQTTLFGELIKLDAAKSHDNDGTLVSYLWIENKTTLLATERSFTKSDFAVGTHNLHLTVTDNSGAKSSDTVTITIQPPINIKPVARAGENQTVLKGETVILDASNSSDKDGNIKSYRWEEAHIHLSDLPVFSAANLSIGSHTITLNVTDNNGETAQDTVQININKPPNLAPNVNAGKDQIVTLGKAVTLNGELSRDDDGSIVSYKWLENGKQLSTAIRFDKKDFKAGEHILVLVAVDDKGKTSSDTVIVVINQPPTASAGVDQVVNENQIVLFDANNSTDIDGKIVSYDWRENGESISTHANFSKSDLRNGRHSIRLKVTDDQGASAVDSVIIDITKKFTLNDTGVIKANNASDNCDDENMRDDDCAQGRDASNNDDSDGHAGFSFVKIGTNGKTLPTSAAEWNCVKDNVTGLLWEVKKGGNGWKGDEGLHDADDRYTWYNTDASVNGGAEGFASQGKGDICFGYDVHAAPTFCNAQAFVKRVNAVNYCNQSNWRLPELIELMGLVDYSRLNPTIDTNYFPQTKASATWTSLPYAGNSHEAWTINFGYGGAGYAGRYFGRAIRLVSDGQ